MEGLCYIPQLQHKSQTPFCCSIPATVNELWSTSPCELLPHMNFTAAGGPWQKGCKFHSQLHQAEATHWSTPQLKHNKKEISVQDVTLELISAKATDHTDSFTLASASSWINIQFIQMSSILTNLNNFHFALNGKQIYSARIFEFAIQITHRFVMRKI